MKDKPEVFLIPHCQENCELGRSSLNPEDRRHIGLLKNMEIPSLRLISSW